MPDNPQSTAKDDSETPSGLDSTFELIERVRRATRNRSSAWWRATSARCAAGSAAACPDGPATWPTRTTLSRTPSFGRLQKIEGFEVRGAGALQAYLRQAVLNRLRDELRRKGRAPVLSTEKGSTSRPPARRSRTRSEARRSSATSGAGPAPPEEREAIIARVEMDYSYAELAEILGKPTPDAARKAAQRALLRLAEEMKT